MAITAQCVWYQDIRILRITTNTFNNFDSAELDYFTVEEDERKNPQIISASTFRILRGKNALNYGCRKLNHFMN